MQLKLSARGALNGVLLWEVTADETGAWTYESRAVEQADGQLAKADSAQLISLFEKVDWSREVLNNPVSADDRIIFSLEVTLPDGVTHVYKFSEAMNHLSWQFRDLVHFLRHNVATAGDPVGPVTGATQEQPPAVQP